ncbi:peroxidase P7-like [Euphorbia lathyris]|uniref:peroxidase P7-like n=1 Tax=Euphorbia lathyris TaxID=212925 RepID=UPI003313AD42
MAFYKTLLLFFLVAACAAFDAMAQLSPDYYSSTCPKAESIVRAGVAEAMKNETRNGASLLRMHFHDCFVQGCDGSILLDDNATFVGEKTAVPNINSIRGYFIIDDIKDSLESACPGVVSCADIVALAARDSVVLMGGPNWEVDLGRRDSLTASKDLANKSIPPPSSDLKALTTSFSVQGLSFKDMVVLSGAHTIGFSRCTSFRGHIYGDSKIDPLYANSLKKICPIKGNDDVLASLDFPNPHRFDNSYYTNLIHKKGLLHSDQVLFDDNSADSLVQSYANTPPLFFKDFADAIVKMSNIKPLTGKQGEVRKNCRKTN